MNNPMNKHTLESLLVDLARKIVGKTANLAYDNKIFRVASAITDADLLSIFDRLNWDFAIISSSDANYVRASIEPDGTLSFGLVDGFYVIDGWTILSLNRQAYCLQFDGSIGWRESLIDDVTLEHLVRHNVLVRLRSIEALPSRSLETDRRTLMKITSRLKGIALVSGMESLYSKR